MATIKVGDVLYTNKIYSSPEDVFECRVLKVDEGKISFSAKSLFNSDICIDSILAEKADSFFSKVAI